MPSGNCLIKTAVTAKQWKKLCDQWRNNQYLYMYASWQHWYNPRKYKFIHLVAISIRLQSMFVHVCPVVILIQSPLKYICTPTGCQNMVIIEIHMLHSVAILIVFRSINPHAHKFNSYAQWQSQYMCSQ